MYSHLAYSSVHVCVLVFRDLVELSLGELEHLLLPVLARQLSTDEGQLLLRGTELLLDLLEDLWTREVEARDGRARSAWVSRGRGRARETDRRRGGNEPAG